MIVPIKAIRIDLNKIRATHLPFDCNLKREKTLLMILRIKKIIKLEIKV